MKPINVHEYEELARERIEPGLWDYYEGGSADEITLRANRIAFERIRLRPRVLVDTSMIDMRTTALGTPIRMPIMVAPTSSHCIAYAEGECATARGAGAAGTLMVASSVSNRTLEEIADAAQSVACPLWFQLYIYEDRSLAVDFVQRAQIAGFRALVLTVDTVRLGKRERDTHNNITTPPGGYLRGNFRDELSVTQPFYAKLSWDTVTWLRSITTLPIILKGILTAEDALLAVEHGVDGIIVSNHGGRQLDTALPTIEALPEVAEAVAGRCEVYLDGGIRRGTDVLKALALGARAVLIGRPTLWGLTVNGSEGVTDVLDILRSELELAMILSGRPTLASIDRSLVKLP